MHLAPIWLIGTLCLSKATIFKEYKKFNKIQEISRKANENQRKFKGNSTVWYVIVTGTNEIKTFRMQTIEFPLNFLEFP